MKLETGAERRAGWVVFAAALALRALYLVQSADSPTFASPITDSETYCDVARSVLRDGNIRPAYFWQPFFYQGFLIVAFAVSHGSILFTKCLQAIIGAATCVATFQLGRRVLPLRPALAAGLIAAAYGPLIFYDAELLSAGWEALLAPVVLICLLDARATPTVRRFVALGLASALSVLARPGSALFVAAACIWALTPPPGTEAPTRRRLSLHAAVLLAAVLLPIMPVASLSHRVSGSWSLLPDAGGIDLYIGNNPDTTHTLSIRPGWEWDNLALLPARHGIAPGRETARFFAHETLKYVKTRPLDYARGLLHKSIEFVSSRELPRSVSIYEARHWSILLTVLVWKFGPVGFPFALTLPLALLGLWHLGRHAPLPLHLLLILYPAAVILVLVSSSARIPVIPVLIVCAAAGAHQLVLWRRTNRTAFTRACLGSVAVLLAASLAGPFPQELNDYAAEMYYCLGTRREREARPADAVPLLQEALRLRPDYPDAHNSLGVAFERLGRDADALAQFRLAVAGNPVHVMARMNLAGSLQRIKQTAEAETQYRRAMLLAPRNADIRGKLAINLITQGETDEAIAIFYGALLIDPQNAVLHNNLGSALNTAGNRKEAAQHFQAAILLNPDLAVAVDNLGHILAANGQVAQARVLYHAALERAAQRRQLQRVHQLEIALAALGEGSRHESRTKPSSSSKATTTTQSAGQTNRPSAKSSNRK